MLPSTRTNKTHQTWGLLKESHPGLCQLPNPEMPHPWVGQDSGNSGKYGGGQFPFLLLLIRTAPRARAPAWPLQSLPCKNSIKPVTEGATRAQIPREGACIWLCLGMGGGLWLSTPPQEQGRLEAKWKQSVWVNHRSENKQNKYSNQHRLETQCKCWQRWGRK